MSSWLWTQAGSQRERLILWAPFFLALGIGFYFALPFEPPAILSLAAFIVFGAPALAFLPWRGQEGLRRMTWLACAGLALMAGGSLAGTVRTAMVAAPMLTRETGPVNVTGTILSLESLGPRDGSRVILGDLKIERLEPERTPAQIRLSVRKDAGLSVGDRISVLAALHPPSPPVAPGAFDFQRYAFFSGFGGMGFAYKAPVIVAHDPPGTVRALAGLRHRVIERIEEEMPGGQAALLGAIVLGERAAISEQDWDAMRDAGLAHILAISGMNIGVVAGLAFFISRLLMAGVPALALRVPIKKIAAVIALCGALFYTVLVGAPVPIQRSMMMTAIVLIAVLFDRSPFSLRLIGLTGFAILLFAPENLIMASFQMSFSAVLGLICFYEETQSLWTRWHRKAGPIRRAAIYVIGVVMTTVVATICTAPFSLYHFQQISLYGVISNALAVPLLTFVIMPSALAAFLVMPLGIERFFLEIAGRGVEAMLEIARWTAGLDGAALHVSMWPVATLVLMTTGGFFLLVWRGPLRLAGFLPLIAVVVLVWTSRPPDILVSSSGKVFGLHEPSGTLSVSARNKDKFVLENWMRLYGREAERPQLWPAEGVKGGLRCDPEACRLDRNGARIVFLRKPYAAKEDCGWAGLVVSADRVDGHLCRAGAIIDHDAIWKNGAYAVWFMDNDIEIENADALRGARPWVVMPEHHRNRSP